MSNFRNIKIETDGPAAVLSICRPDKMNALNDETVMEIGAAIAELQADESVRGIIITGGPLPLKEGKPPRHSFISGADIDELAKQGVITGKQKSLLGQGVLNAIENCTKPVIAAINGYCFGGGFELALACHWRYAGEAAQIGLTETTLGIIPGYGGTQRLSRLVGPGVALEMISRGERIGAEEAMRRGIVNRVYPQAELMTGAKAVVGEIAKTGPLAVAFSIEAVRRGMETTLDEGLRIEADLFGVISASEDMREGLNAFLEKRLAQFKNR